MVAPIAEEPKSGIELPDNKKFSTDVIQKIKDEIATLPFLWIDKPTISSFLNDVFAISNLKDRYKQNGLQTLLGSVIPNRARAYIYACDTIISLLAPNTAISKISNTVRNFTLLDSLSDDITEKLETSHRLDSYNTLAAVFKRIKDCPIRLNDYYIDSYSDIPMGGLFMVLLASNSIGSVVELKSPLFSRRPIEPGVIHCKLIYRSSTVDRDMYGYITRSGEQYFSIIAEIIEYNMYIVMAMPGTADRADLSIKRLDTGTRMVYGLYRNEDDYNHNGLAWCRALPFSMVDFSEYICHVTAVSVQMHNRSILHRRIENEIFDQNTNALVQRIVNAGKIGCSRSYALVGIPGTGKSFIMNKIGTEFKDSAIITLYLPESGLNENYVYYIGDILHALAVPHIYIMLDDFDKYLSDDNSGKTCQQLIAFFDILHTCCPGGVNKDGVKMPAFTLVATMNNPKSLENAIIKRSERFDEVIEIGLPQPSIYGKRLNKIKDQSDKTDFEAKWFQPAYWYMRKKVITLADIGNVYDIMKTHRNKDGSKCSYRIADILYAVKFISTNRKAASKEYEIR